MLLGAALLRPDDQEIHDHENQQKRNELDDHVHAARRSSGGLGECWRDHGENLRMGKGPHVPRLRGEPEKVRRTIATGLEKATTPGSRSNAGIAQRSVTAQSDFAKHVAPSEP
ncbi:hypothetical protein GCM10007036_25900 [Alsobacter metallidurans]|uniref:Uncharacterized protein n=1 Tax=Alsobacter metallidurans TaxID=340221 RepID=A0A917I753_9HYPH|nr:hypothetical protein GCM10007036_25900 [Alsobacter metallidurans]